MLLQLSSKQHISAEAKAIQSKLKSTEAGVGELWINTIMKTTSNL